MPHDLQHTVRTLMADDRGLLAMDESTGTCNKRFAAVGIPQTAEMHRRYRQLIVTAPGLSRSVSGAILFDETLRQTLDDGTPFAAALERVGIVPGIKVDAGTVGMPKFSGEKITEGLDGLAGRLDEYRQTGAKFAKWRAVLTIDAAHGLPTRECIAANAHALARYAATCQAHDVVPIVEPEVLMDGAHDLQVCYAATRRVLHAVFAALFEFRVDLDAMLLKPNMVLPGQKCPEQEDAELIAAFTVGCLRETVPATCGGIAFLSGGQEAKLASQRLNAMHAGFGGQLPWPLTFSFSRAIQQPALELWKGQAANVEAAQTALVHRADCNRAARRGRYDAAADAPAV